MRSIPSSPRFTRLAKGRSPLRPFAILGLGCVCRPPVSVSAYRIFLAGANAAVGVRKRSKNISSSFAQSPFSDSGLVGSRVRPIVSLKSCVMRGRISSIDADRFARGCSGCRTRVGSSFCHALRCGSFFKRDQAFCLSWSFESIDANDSNATAERPMMRDGCPVGTGQR